MPHEPRPGLGSQRGDIHRCMDWDRCYHLTKRDCQVLSAIARGVTSDKELAAELKLSRQTIKNRVHILTRIFGVDDRISLIEEAHKVGAIELERDPQPGAIVITDTTSWIEARTGREG